MSLTAIALNATLKPSTGEPSSTDRLIGEIATALQTEGVETVETIRLADHDIKPGVTSDEGEGDAWPALRGRILAADILILATPIWMGQPSSVSKRVLERMDAFFSEADEKGRTPAYGKVAVVAVVGNEDGAHHVSAELFQALNDVGYTLPAAAVTYWVGEAMDDVNYVDLPETPKKIDQTTKMLARNAAHLAGLLSGKSYPGLDQN
jgi:multimeric flavodoxin WrbA